MYIIYPNIDYQIIFYIFILDIKIDYEDIYKSFYPNIIKIWF